MRPLGGVVGKADAAVIAEACEDVQALENAIRRLGYGGVTRELRQPLGPAARASRETRHHHPFHYVRVRALEGRARGARFRKPSDQIPVRLDFVADRLVTGPGHFQDLAPPAKLAMNAVIMLIITTQEA